MSKPFGVVYPGDGRRVITYDKKVFLSLVDIYVQPMDVIGVLGGVNIFNPLSLFGRWIQSETNAQIGHVECVGERDAITDKATIYTTGFKFRQVDLAKELGKQKRIIIKRMPGLTKQQMVTGLKTMASFIGKPYPVFEPIMMKIQSVLDPSAYQLWLDSPLPICTQSIGYTFNEQMGIPISPGLGKHWSKMTPIDIVSDDRMSVVAYWNWPLPDNEFLE